MRRPGGQPWHRLLPAGAAPVSTRRRHMLDALALRQPSACHLCDVLVLGECDTKAAHLQPSLEDVWHPFLDGPLDGPGRCREGRHNLLLVCTLHMCQQSVRIAETEGTVKVSHPCSVSERLTCFPRKATSCCSAASLSCQCLE